MKLSKKRVAIVICLILLLVAIFTSVLILRFQESISSVFHKKTITAPDKGAYKDNSVHLLEIPIKLNDATKLYYKLGHKTEEDILEFSKTSRVIMQYADEAHWCSFELQISGKDGAVTFVLKSEEQDICDYAFYVSQYEYKNNIYLYYESSTSKLIYDLNTMSATGKLGTISNVKPLYYEIIYDGIKTDLGLIASGNSTDGKEMKPQFVPGQGLLLKKYTFPGVEYKRDFFNSKTGLKLYDKADYSLNLAGRYLYDAKGKASSIDYEVRVKIQSEEFPFFNDLYDLTSSLLPKSFILSEVSILDHIYREHKFLTISDLKGNNPWYFDLENHRSLGPAAKYSNGDLGLGNGIEEYLKTKEQKVISKTINFFDLTLK